MSHATTRTKARGRIVATIVPRSESGQPAPDCTTCKADLGHLKGYVPAPAHFLADLYASDYTDLNMGIEHDAKGAALCWDCACNLLPWAKELNQ